jgi:hypothetical protein
MFLTLASLPIAIWTTLISINAISVAYSISNLKSFMALLIWGIKVVFAILGSR